MKRPIAYLRADGSHAIGLGHLYRAYALSQELKKSKFSVIVGTRVFDSVFENHFKDLFAQSQINIQPLGSEEEFLKHLSEIAPDYLFLDLLERPEYSPLLPALPNILSHTRSICLDGFYSNRFTFDLIVLPYFSSKDVTRSSRHILSGPKYFIFRNELEEFSKKTNEPDWRHVQRVLITQGGSDPGHATFKIVQAVCPKFPELEFRAILGPGFNQEDREQLMTYSRVQPNLRLTNAPAHLGEQYLWTDVAVTSAGLSKYETALFGIPSLLIAQTELEETLACEFETLGSSSYLGPAKSFNTDQLTSRLSQLLGSPESLQKMSTNGKLCVDAMGCRRIIEYIQKELS